MQICADIVGLPWRFGGSGGPSRTPLEPPADPARLDTGAVPRELRFDFWRQNVAKHFTPVEVRTERPDDFQGLIEMHSLGQVSVASVSSTECTGLRTARMLRQDDPELLQLAFSINSSTAVHQQRREAAMGPSDFVLYSTSRPYVITSTAKRDLVRGTMVLLPRVLLPMPARTVEKLMPAVLPGGSAIGGLLSRYLTGVVRGAGSYRPAHAVQLGTILVDLLALLVAEVADPCAPAPPGSRQQTLLPRIHAFVEEHLDDPRLTPASVAAAHHISLRMLHRLFQDQERGIAAWIQHRRLERCRRELRDPDLRDRSIRAIAGRHGFASAAHFSRLFRAAYGFTPTDYRAFAGAEHND